MNCHKDENAATRKYTTADEIAFLKALGKSRSGAPRPEILRRYREAMKLRQRWGLIDPVVVSTYLTLEIGREEDSAS